jgi:hypothetical protein
MDLQGYHLARALYDRLREKHSVEFHSGAYIIEDPFHETFEFLRRSAGCYSRISSHLKDLGTPQPKMYGIDIPPLAYGTEVVVALKRTVLFAAFSIAEQPLLFFKPEEYGTKGVASLIGHAGTFVQSTLLNLNAPHDNNIQRKERVPADFKEAFGQLLQRQRYAGLRKNADPEDQARFDAAKKAGVFAMAALLQQKEDDSADIFKQYVAKNLSMRRDSTGAPCPTRVLPSELLRWEKNFRFRLGREVFMELVSMQVMAQAPLPLSYPSSVPLPLSFPTPLSSLLFLSSRTLSSPLTHTRLSPPQVFMDIVSMKVVMGQVHRAGRRHVALLQRLTREPLDCLENASQLGNSVDPSAAGVHQHQRPHSSTGSPRHMSHENRECMCKSTTEHRRARSSSAPCSNPYLVQCSLLGGGGATGPTLALAELHTT